MDLSRGEASAAVPGGVLCPHGEQTQERQPGWASHTLQLTRADAQYPTSALVPVALPWVVRPPHWDRLCPQVVEAPKMQFVPDAFQSEREAQRALFSGWACDSCHQHRWRLIPLCEPRALGLGRGTTIETFLGLTSENLGNLGTSLLHAKRQDMTR